MQNSMHATPPKRKRSLVILCFAAMLALMLLLIFDVHRNASRRTQRDFSRIFVESLNSTVFGRRLSSDAGDYFLQIHYSKPTARFAPSQLQSLPGGGQEWWGIHHDSGGCPNGYNHTNPLMQRVLSPEVCHTLNIYRCKQQIQTALLPVLVYVNEGSWLGRSDANLDPESTIGRLACRGMIVVSINYRMGPYGFLNVEDPAMSFRHNLALHDIRTALAFVHDTIMHFGGHPKHVTVMAKGIGAQLVSVLSSSVYNANNVLFHRAILLSGSAYAPTLFLAPQLSAFSASKYFAMAAKCSTAQWAAFANHSLPPDQISQMEQCLAALSIEAIENTESVAYHKVPTFIRWQLLREAGIAPERNQTAEELQRRMHGGSVAAPPIPLIMGTCHRERKLGPSMKEISQMEMERVRNELVRMADLQALPYSRKVIDYYMRELAHLRDGNESTAQAIMQKIQYDFVELGPMLVEALQRTSQSHPSRVYWFDFEVPQMLNKSKVDVASVGEDDSFYNIFDPSIELPCIDDLLLNPTPVHFTPSSNHSDEREKHNRLAIMTETFAQFLSNFVTYGDPNIGDEENSIGLLEWPTFDPKTFLISGDQKDNRAKVRKTRRNPKVLRLQKTELEVANFSELTPNQLHFWLCEMAQNMGLSHKLC